MLIAAEPSLTAPVNITGRSRFWTEGPSAMRVGAGFPSSFDAIAKPALRPVVEGSEEVDLSSQVGPPLQARLFLRISAAEAEKLSRRAAVIRRFRLRLESEGFDFHSSSAGEVALGGGCRWTRSGSVVLPPLFAVALFVEGAHIAFDDRAL